MEKLQSHLMSFYYVAHFMSFTKAANHLHVSKSYISKQISDLENKIATTLFHRSTRSIQLTQAGESIFEHAKLIVQEFQNIENTITGLQEKPKGLIRITSPAAFADYVLAPSLPQFFNQYPEISLEMKFTGELLNLVDEKIDVAIRLTHEPPLDRVAKRIGEYQMIICASPSYFEKHSIIKVPQDLSSHDCLAYSTEKNFKSWSFVQNKDNVSVEITPKLIANNCRVILESAKAGLGIARLPNYVVEESIRNQDLVPILRKFYPIPIPIYGIYAWSRVISPKINAFIEFSIVNLTQNISV